MIGTILAFAIIVAATLLGIAARQPAYVFLFFFGLLVLDVAGSALVRSMHGWDFEERRIRSRSASVLEPIDQTRVVTERELQR